ncbi:MAG: YitT family protein [Lachnospiraceae bacterium]|nr:YitT family protein [Lachnospiraceae bacterium]MBP5184897.1 YitT family protein [Lachnospiraceae bacterium]
MNISSLAKNRFEKCLLVAIGACIYSIGVTVFVTPLNLYAGGVAGFSQLIRTIIVDYLKVPIPSGMDLAGILYGILNVPLVILAYKKISRSFFYRTLIAIIVTTVIMSFVKLQKPIIDDMLTSCIIGGIVSGVGVGIMLMYGGSGGGMDVIGMYLTKQKGDASVGKVALTFNIALYALCAILFDIPTAIYSIIYSAANSVATDRMHYQNIMVQVMIFTKKDGVADPIMNELGRGVTEWVGDGAYTKEGTHILVTLISKYEIARISKMVRTLDPHAFITYTSVSRVDGHFIKKLQA